VFTAALPAEAQGPKYDETATSMMPLMRYGCRLPGNRLDHVQATLQSPVPATTQWQVINERVELVRPAYDEITRQAAQGGVLHNDDSTRPRQGTQLLSQALVQVHRVSARARGANR
jgi:hypothetical protein